MLKYDSGSVFDFVLRPVRSLVHALNEDTLKPVEQAEHDMLNTVQAIDRVTQSIEQHIEVIDTLATSIAPLTESVDRLTETMRGLVMMLAPLAGTEREIQRAEHDVERAERFFGIRRHKPPADREAGQSES